MRDSRKQRIGLLGGSFNPAHAGHLHLSTHAIKTLRLDALWWLVSPQNPLKPTKGMEPYATRLDIARRTARHPRIHVLDFESKHGLRYSIDTLRLLRRLYPNTEFFWIIGADNLAQLSRWRRWRELVHLAHLAVFDRAPFSHAALRAKSAIYLKAKRVSPRRLQHGRLRAGQWAYSFMPRHAESSTRLRFMQR